MLDPDRHAIRLIGRYARYHRDQRNITTHFIGVPLVVFALGVLLGRPTWAGGWSPAWALWTLATLWYLTRGDFLLGLATSAVTGALVALAAPLAAGGTTLWLGAGVGTLLLGWLAQAIGHYYEGRRPAVLDDPSGVLVGPMFLVAQWLFAQGWRAALRAEVERLAGPTHLRDLTQPA